jgi:hypothetical protein
VAEQANQASARLKLQTNLDSVAKCSSRCRRGILRPKHEIHSPRLPPVLAFLYENKEVLSIKPKQTCSFNTKIHQVQTPEQLTIPQSPNWVTKDPAMNLAIVSPSSFSNFLQTLACPFFKTPFTFFI